MATRSAEAMCARHRPGNHASAAVAELNHVLVPGCLVFGDLGRRARLPWLPGTRPAGSSGAAWRQPRPPSRELGVRRRERAGLRRWLHGNTGSSADRSEGRPDAGKRGPSRGRPGPRRLRRRELARAPQVRQDLPGYCGVLRRAAAYFRRSETLRAYQLRDLLRSGRRGRRFKSGHPDPAHRPLAINAGGLFHAVQPQSTATSTSQAVSPAA